MINDYLQNVKSNKHNCQNILSSMFRLKASKIFFIFLKLMFYKYVVKISSYLDFFFLIYNKKQIFHKLYSYMLITVIDRTLKIKYFCKQIINFLVL